MPSQLPSSSATNTTLSSLVAQSSQYDSSEALLALQRREICLRRITKRSRISRRLAASSRRTGLIAMS